jgi:hypothetical protein
VRALIKEKKKNKTLTSKEPEYMQALLTPKPPQKPSNISA